MLNSISLADWQLLARKEQDVIAMKRLLLHLEPKPYPAFVELVERAVAFVIDELTIDPSSKQNMSEDELTEMVRLGLFFLGFNATHDTKTGGHCDLVVEEMGNLRWLAEAKKIDKVDNSHLYDGYLQLTTRYVNGRRTISYGGMLIFSYVPNNKDILESWSTYLVAKRSEVSVLTSQYSSGVFDTTDKIESTGVPYQVKHSLVQLYFDPKK